MHHRRTGARLKISDFDWLIQRGTGYDIVTKQCWLVAACLKPTLRVCSEKLSTTDIQQSSNAVVTYHFSFCYIMKHISYDVRFLPFQELKDSDIPVYDVMSTERCVKLMAVGMANNLDEVWISENPTLLMVYFNQYLPNLFRWYVLLSVASLFLRRQ